MPATTTVKLFTPFEHHGVTIDSVELREPSGALYSQLGDPRILVRNADGGYYVEKDDVIRRYLDRSIVHQDGSVLLGLMDMADVMQIKEQLFLFSWPPKRRLSHSARLPRLQPEMHDIH